MQWRATSLAVKNRGDVDGDILTAEMRSVHLNLELNSEGRAERPLRRTVDLTTGLKVTLRRSHPEAIKTLNYPEEAATRGGVCEEFKRSEMIVETTY